MYRFIVAAFLFSFTAQALAESYHFRERPAARRKAYAKPAYSKPRRDYRPSDEDERPRGGYCSAPVRGLGTQWIGTKGALDAAWKDWAERVRFDLGESFLDRTHAVGFVSRCGRVSIGEIAGQVLYRCEIVARPCKADFAETALEAEGNTEK